MDEATMTVRGNIATELSTRRVGPEAKHVVSFRVISSPRRYDPATDSYSDLGKLSARVTCWQRLADNVLSSLKKGDPVVIHGRVVLEEYEANGERRQSVEIKASTVGADLGRCGVMVSRRRTSDTDDVTDLQGGPASGDDAVPGAFPGVTGAEAPDVALLSDPDEDEVDGSVPTFAASA